MTAITPQNYVASALPSVPKYDGLIPQPTDDVLSFEFSEFTKLDPAKEPHGYISQYAKAQERLDFARAKLVSIKDEPIWKTANGNNKDVPLTIWYPLQDARKAVAPFKQFDTTDAWAVDNEVPRYAPDGTMLAEDAAKVGSSSGAKEVIRPGANTYIENIAVRWPADQLQGVNALKFAAARKKAEDVSKLLTWDESSQHVPNIDGAISGIDDIKQMLEEGLGTATGKGDKASMITKLGNLYHSGPLGKAAVIGGAVAAVGGVGYLAKKALD